MKKTIPILVILLVAAVNQVFSQLNVSKVENSSFDPASEGFFYSLPRTGLKIDITVKKTQKIKGPYSEFADKYLGLSQVITVNSTESEISEVRMTTFTDPDPAEYYFVQLTGKTKDRKAVEFYLTENGSLGGISPGLAGLDLNNKGKSLSTPGITMPEISSPTMFERVDTVIRKISLDTTTIEQKIFKKISTAKTSDQKAKEAADFILKLDESMFNLINGYQEVNYEKGTMEFMYSQMNNLKNEYLQLFKGVTAEYSETYSYTYFPDKNNDPALYLLSKFSSSKGILDKTAVSGDLIQLEITKLNNSETIRAITELRNSQVKEARGIYYRIPEKAEISIKVGGKAILNAEYPINQLGVVTFLPATMINNLELFDNSGSLKHVILK
jgi:hypothetical protein